MSYNFGPRRFASRANICFFLENHISAGQLSVDSSAPETLCCLINRQLKFLSHGRTPEVNILHAKTLDKLLYLSPLVKRYLSS